MSQHDKEEKAGGPDDPTDSPLKTKIHRQKPNLPLIVNFSKQEDALKNVDFPAADKALMMKIDSKALLGD